MGSEVVRASSLCVEFVEFVCVVAWWLRAYSDAQQPEMCGACPAFPLWRFGAFALLRFCGVRLLYGASERESEA